MDSNTKKILNGINRRIPSHLAKNTTKIVVDTSEEELARAALKSPDITKEKKRKIHRYLEAGKFRRTEELINEPVVNQIDQHNARAVKRAIRSGQIPDPMTDPFYRSRVRRAEALRRNPPQRKKVSEQEMRQAGNILRTTRQNDKANG